ncbi:MAG: transporter [Desulfuromonadales bacterium]|nr:transporter [Desulfuromonadales bacterium]
MKITGFSLKNLAVLTLYACSVLCAANAGATEGGGGSSPLGAEGVMSAALPPPGFYYLNYLTHYSADRLNDKNGNKLPVDFHVGATADVSRFVYMTNYHLLGGLFGVYAVVPLVHVSATIGGVGNTTSGVGDMTFSPFMLSWHGKSLWHAATAIEFTAPTGSYDKSRLANVGRNYWTFQPIVNVTLLTESGLDLTTKIMYDINTENTDTHYTSGHEFHFDYASTYHWGAWNIGATGYFYKQVTKDHGAGAGANGGNKGQVFAVGPTVKYSYKNMSLEAKYQKEMLAENKAEGDRYWLKLIWAF